MTKRQRRLLRKQEKMQERLQEQKKKKTIRLVISLVVILVIGGASYYFIATASDAGGEDGDNTIAASDDMPMLGNPDASVVVTEYSDFSCPACAQAASIPEQLFDEYGDQIKIVFNSFNLRHQWSQKSLEAGACANVQGAFWPYSSLLFSKQAEWVSDDDAVTKLKGYAQDLGLNMEAFENCLDSGMMSSRIARETARAGQQDINATPTFTINDQKLVGAKPLSAFKEIIDPLVTGN